MQILFVATNLPVPPNSGQSIRSLSILRALAASGHTLNFISFASKSRLEDLHPLPSFCSSIDLLDREMRNLTLQTDYLPRLKCLLKLKCYSVERFRCEAMYKRIEANLNGAKYDLIVCDGIYALVNIPRTTIPIFLNCHNVEFMILRRYAEIERNPVKKYYATLESNLMRMAERNGCRQIAGAMACSQIDLEILQKLQPDLSISVIPNVVDTDSIQPLNSARLQGTDPVLFFQGVMDWYPNRDAVEFFARCIFPRVLAEYPEARFVVAGRNPPSDFVEKFKSDPKIEFTGTVSDMRPYLAAATVVIVPLRLGGGTRIKILEACAAGKPIVSTSIGAEGLDLASGKEILLADDPAEFARSVVNLLRDPVRCNALAKSARTAVVERYSQLTLKDTVDAFVLKHFTGAAPGVS
jgi:glycosyltransferase involved in cell wall biosynthesis